MGSSLHTHTHPHPWQKYWTEEPHHRHHHYHSFHYHILSFPKSLTDFSGLLQIHQDLAREKVCETVFFQAQGIPQEQLYSPTCYWWSGTQNSQKSVNSMSQGYYFPLDCVHICRNSNVILSWIGQILLSVCETRMTSLYPFVTATLEEEKWKYAANDFVYMLLPCRRCFPMTST